MTIELGDWPTLSSPIWYAHERGEHDDKDIRSLAKFLLTKTLLRTGAVPGERRWLLQCEPELRRQLDIQPLLAIMPSLTAFRCHPTCSVARNEAIKGSDIDAGLAVLSEGISPDKEQEFVDELRRQGFTATSPAEFRAARENFCIAEARNDNPDLLDEARDAFRRAEVDQIYFATKQDLDAQVERNGPLTQELAVYLAGHIIWAA